MALFVHLFDYDAFLLSYKQRNDGDNPLDIWPVLHELHKEVAGKGIVAITSAFTHTSQDMLPLEWFKGKATALGWEYRQSLVEARAKIFPRLNEVAKTCICVQP